MVIPSEYHKARSESKKEARFLLYQMLLSPDIKQNFIVNPDGRRRFNYGVQIKLKRRKI
jgi:hypothetical protein